MADKFLTPEQNIKVKKNLLRFFLFTVTMIFAGLTSAYVVSMGEYFWMNVGLPDAFKYSTACILVSSVFLILAARGVKNGQSGLIKASLGIAMILGLAFGYFQYQGWGQLFDQGAPLRGPIMNQLGQYGKDFTFSYQGKEITFDNSSYYWRGEKLKQDVMDKMNELCRELNSGAVDANNNYKLSSYGSEFILNYHGTPVTYFDNKLQLNGTDFNLDLHYRLRYFSESILEGRGDFILHGEYGKDFVVYYKGDPLEYKNRTFYRKGKKLTPAQLDRLNNQDNTASSYIYAFTFVHLLHWVGGIIALIVMFFRGLKMKYSQQDSLGLKLGSTYWHFLGILWLYLYLFLIFIH